MRLAPDAYRIRYAVLQPWRKMLAGLTAKIIKEYPGLALTGDRIPAPDLTVDLTCDPRAARTVPVFPAVDSRCRYVRRRTLACMASRVENPADLSSHSRHIYSVRPIMSRNYRAGSHFTRRIPQGGPPPTTDDAGNAG